jgi:hypothetical protein
MGVARSSLCHVKLSALLVYSIFGAVFAFSCLFRDGNEAMSDKHVMYE